MQAVMLAEGYDFYETPLQSWLSHTLYQVHQRGGKAILWTEYQKEKEESTNNLLKRLDRINKEEWQR